jgi:HK97 family phage major capsid protein
MATLAEKIAAAKAALVEKKDALAAISNKMAALVGDEQVEQEDSLAAEELAGQIELLVKDIEVMERTEAALARAARPVIGDAGSAARSAMPGIAPGGHIQRKPDINLFVRSAIAAFESHETHYPIEAIIERRWPGQQDLIEVAKLVTGVRKGVQAPAQTMVPEWAGSLVRETFAAFLDLIHAESVIPRLGLATFDFNGAGFVTIPMRLPAAASGQNLAGAFRKEGDPIRVGAARMGSKKLRAYTMGVIGTFTMEMLEASPINFENAVRQWMLEDTSEAMDKAFLDGENEVPDTRPAGIANGLAPEDTRPSSGNDAANIQADIRAMVTGLTSSGLGRRPVWIMNPQRAAGVAASWNAVGNPAFPSAANGQLAGYPIVTSINVDPALVYLVDAAEIPFAGGTPKFAYSDQAAIVEQDGLPRTAGVSAPVGTLDAGVPARSLWQTYSGGIRAVWELSWARNRDHAVQMLTAVGW